MLKSYAKEKGFTLTGNNGFDSLSRPNIDLYYMNFCFVSNLRSIDESSKCGCIAVSKDGSLLSSGYNSPIRGSDDKNVPQTRPEKYLFFEHSERNAIYNAARHGIALDLCTFYVTGFPCFNCLRGMVQSGCERVVYGPNVVKMAEVKDFGNYEKMLKGQSVVIERFKHDKGLYFLNPIAKWIVDKKKKQGIKQIDFEYNGVYASYSS